MILAHRQHHPQERVCQQRIAQRLEKTLALFPVVQIRRHNLFELVNDQHPRFFLAIFIHGRRGGFAQGVQIILQAGVGKLAGILPGEVQAGDEVIDKDIAHVADPFRQGAPHTRRGQHDKPFILQARAQPGVDERAFTGARLRVE